MKRKRFTEEQIIGVLREQEAGAKVADLCRRNGISDATFYNWKAKFGGMDVSEAKRLKALEDENARLKKLLAEQMLDAAALRELLSKNVWSAPSAQASWTIRHDSLLKCIRPLASGLLLQPGHDEIRPLRSRIMVRAGARFFARAYDASINRLVITSPSLAVLRPVTRLRDCLAGIARLVE
jgi:putative transposase